MKKLTQKQITAAAAAALAMGNPYKAAATAYQIDREPRYIYAGESMTAAEIDTAYLQTAAKDYRSGYADRAAGYYDKWYRYTRADEGRAYDMGVRAAANLESTPAEFHIIPA